MNFVQSIIAAKNFKKNVIITFFTLSGLAWFSMWVYGHYYISTDNAYINANVVQIAPRISGTITALFVENNQPVKNGELLFEIDAKPFLLAVNSAMAALAVGEAELENALHVEKRVTSLVRKKFLPTQEGDNSTANLKVAIAKVEQAKVNLAQAKLNLSYTRIYAPTSGSVSNVTLRVGDIVSANQPIFALISDETFWVDANFKETEIASIKPGQIASIVSDVYVNHTYRGVVESLSGATGSAFSLLPPQNATGNWVKITQRVPIRIRIIKPDPHFPLRIGTSATVKIHL